jgi:hypothetical protein
MRTIIQESMIMTAMERGILEELHICEWAMWCTEECGCPHIKVHKVHMPGDYLCDSLCLRNRYRGKCSKYEGVKLICVPAEITDFKKGE